MGIDEWQKDRIRVRLAKYREAKGAPPKELPYAKTFLRIQDCPVLDQRMFTSGANQFRYEAFRRFCHGDDKTQDFKIEAVRDFLIFEGFLSQEELTDKSGDFGELLALHGYLANSTAQASDRMARLPDGNYRQASAAAAYDGLVLQFVRDPARGLFMVEETHRFPDEKNGMALTQKGARQSVSRRKGYGFYSTKLCLLHIFLRGRTGQDRVHYVEFGTNDDLKPPYLVRVGGIPETERRNPDPDALRACQIFRYQHEADTLPPDKVDEPEADPDDGVYNWMETSRINPEAAVGTTNEADEEQKNLSRFIEMHFARGLALLLARGANPNVQDGEGMTALHHAAGLGDRGCIRVLVKSGACDYLIRDNYGRYASDLAIEWARDFGVARLLSMKRRQQAFARGVPAYIAP